MNLSEIKVRSYYGAVLAVGLLLAVLLGLTVAYLDVGTWGLSKVLLLVLGVLLLVPFGVTMLRGKHIDFLEPINVVVIGYAMFLLVRPIYILVYDDLDMINFLGADPKLIPVALFHAILGLASLYLGYYGPIGPAIANATPTAGERVSPRRLRNWGVLLIVLGSSLYGVFLGQKASTAGNAYSESTAYFYLGIDVVGVGILLLFYWMWLSPKWRRILVVVGLLAVFFVVATNAGNRYRILYLGIALLASYYLLRDSSFRLRNLMLLLPPVLIYLNAIGLVRQKSEGTLANLSQYDSQSAWQRFLSSSGDLNIFDTYVRIISVVPEIHPYLFPRRTFAYLFTAFVPRTVWPGKPEPSEKLVTLYMIGEWGAEKAGGGGYAYSLLGSFYVEGGLLAVLIGMILFGAFCRAVWAYHTKNRNIGSKMILAVTLPAVFFAQRGGFNDNDAVWYLTYLVPVIIGLRYASTGKQTNEKEALEE
jgi:oligosaccharide repeat unit polymerase